MENKKQEYLNLNFFKMVWYSIAKYENYPEMAAAGLKKAILYFIKLLSIFCIIFGLIYIYYIDKIATYEDQNLTLSEKIIEQIENISYDEGEKEFVEANIREYSQNELVLMILISVFISFFFAIFVDVFTLSIFGIFTCAIAKIKMNYKAIFNMSVYAMTLSIILRLIYVAISMLTTFKIKYFEVLYVAVSYIILAAAIFMIKSDVIKQHLELMRIIEQGKEKIEQTITIPKKPKEDEEENDDEKEEKKEENDTKEQGSNA